MQENTETATNSTDYSQDISSWEENKKVCNTTY